MRKIIVSGVVAVSLAIAGSVSAQAYYPTTAASACVRITRDLSIGARGSDVKQLQVFLVAQNYPGSGSWMETGYFGAATQAALRNYQSQHNLPQSGVANATTRASIAACGAAPSIGAYSTTYPYSNSYPYQYPTFPNQYPQYPTYPTYPNQYGAPTISSLSPTTAAPGSYITIYGSGFDSSNNTVSVNGTMLSGIASYNGTALNFTVPYTAVTGNVSVYVTNTRGTSNTLSLYITGQNTSSVSLSSLSPNAAAQGSSITLYGSGFDYANNTVYMGGSPLYSIASYNGTSLTFTVPFTVSGSVQVYVTNSRGTSNALTLSVLGSNNPCSTYPYNYGSTCGCTTYPYNYGTNCGCTYSTNCGLLSISALSPQQGAVGSAVTVYGSGFSTSGNTVRFGQGIITGLNSSDGRSISFIVPSQLTGYGSTSVTLGSYNVSVTNASGASSNSLPFTVTSLGSSGIPSIVSVNGPTSLGLGQSGTWTLSINTISNQYVTVMASWGDTGNGYVNAAAPQTIYGSGTQTVTFSHAYFTAGTYTVTFSVQSSTSQGATYTATVTVSGNSSQLSLSYLSPNSGRVGTQIAIVGSGFTTSDNTVHFGTGGTQHVPSYNGTTIYYTIPQYVSPCDVAVNGSYCATYVQQVLPGTYQIYVTNASGQTNQLPFTVTQ